MVSKNKLSVCERARILACLIEGNSIRSTCRMTGAAKNTVIKLLVNLSGACSEYQDAALRDLPCKRVPCDEVRAFVYRKAKNVPAERRGEYVVGDVWTWTTICADCKLAPSWLVGERNDLDASASIKDLTNRLANRVQFTTDGHKPSLGAVEGVSGGEIDCAQLSKLYGQDARGEMRYSPAVCIGAEQRRVTGNPDPADLSTGYVEHQNLTKRMGTRRFNRLTNAFSKKGENLAHAVSLPFMFYNFARVHTTLGTTPADETGVADQVWTLDEIAGLLDRPRNCDAETDPLPSRSSRYGAYLQASPGSASIASSTSRSISPGQGRADSMRRVESTALSTSAKTRIARSSRRSDAIWKDASSPRPSWKSAAWRGSTSFERSVWSISADEVWCESARTVGSAPTTTRSLNAGPWPCVAIFDRAAAALAVEQLGSLTDPQHLALLRSLLNTYQFGLAY